MDYAVRERRRDARFGQPAIARVRGVLRPATTVVLVDLSAGGALVQAGRVLRPGARVHMHLLVNGRSLITAARVLRCSVASLDAEHGVRYEGALKFESRCDTLWDAGAPAGCAV